MRRMWGLKLGWVAVISFLYLCQTSLKKLIPALYLGTYIKGFTVPTMIGKFDFTIIVWVVFILSLLSFILAALDKPPFNY